MAREGVPYGPVALVGSGEYLDVMLDVDRSLLADRPQRAVFLATAAAEEGEASVRRWLDLGTRHFERLGVEPVPLPVLTREDAAREDLAALVAGAGLVYLSGGNPGYLASTLRGTLVWTAIAAAWRSGTALAGCSTGACALSYVAEDVRAARRRAAGLEGTAGGRGAAGAGPAAEKDIGAAAPAERAARQPSGLAAVAEVAVIPHYNRMIEWVPDFAERLAAGLPESVTILGIDEDTAVTTFDPPSLGRRRFSVAGRQAAWVIDRDGSRTPYEVGSTFELGLRVAADGRSGGAGSGDRRQARSAGDLG